MTTAQMSVFFAVLSLACWAGTAAALGLLAFRRRAAPLLDAAPIVALWLAWLVASVATAGSLYYSRVAHFEPCELCWYQRICMYPLAVVLLVAAIRRDVGVWRYALPLALVGAVIAGYHTQLQAFPDQSTFCATTVPCNIRDVWEFGFVSIPFMALAAFAFIITMLAIAARRPAPAVRAAASGTAAA